MTLRARLLVENITVAILSFILGYFAFGIYPIWPVVVDIFNRCM